MHGGLSSDIVSFSYDGAGRIVGARAGSRSAAVAYDDVDRIVRVDLDGDTLLSYDYGALDADAMAERDRRTGEVAVPQGASGVFGTMDAVVRARPAAADYGIVAYDAGLKTLVLREDAPAPDAVLLSGLERRMVPLQAAGVDSGPFGHDKPSSSLFIPPEFRSVNCYLCTGVVDLLRISVQGTVVGVPTNIDVDLRGFCLQAGGEAGTPGYGWGHYPWRHEVYFGDGYWETHWRSRGAYFADISVPHTYWSSGTFYGVGLRLLPMQLHFLVG